MEHTYTHAHTYKQTHALTHAHAHTRTVHKCLKMMRLINMFKWKKGKVRLRKTLRCKIRERMLL